MSNLKTAIVYDRINKWGGAERVLLDLKEIFPNSELFTAFYDPKKSEWANSFEKINTSFLQKIPFVKNFHEIFPWLTEIAFEQFDFSNFDLVISITSAEAKSLITKPETLHVCYCLTPTRYLWSGYYTYLRSPGIPYLNWLIKFLFPIFALSLRLNDQVCAYRPDKFFSISKTVQKRISKYYKIDSKVIYPGVDTDLFRADTTLIKNKYYLVVSRLIAAKRIDVVVECFNKNGLNLKIIGTGREIERLQKISKSNIEFLGELTDKTMISYYQGCEALIVPGEEDFGLTSLEAQSCGKPVIAFSKGGLQETVIDSVTGVLFDYQDSSFLQEAINKLKTLNIKVSDCRKQAESYSRKKFIKEFNDEIEKIWRTWKKKIDM